MTTSDAVKRTEEECDCFCLFVLCLAPPPHSCQLDCLGVAVYLSIFGFSGCCCLDMNHESFSHSLQEMLGASCYGYSTSWLGETPCEINLTSETYSFCLSFSLSLSLSLTDAALVGTASFTLQLCMNKPCVKSRVGCKVGCVGRMEGSSARLSRLNFQGFSFYFFHFTIPHLKKTT